MFDCLSSGFFVMKADVMSLAVTQDPRTNSLTKVWTVSASSVPVLVEPIKTVSASARVSGKEFKNHYLETDFFNLTTNYQLSKRNRITNVRDADGKLIYKEVELAGDPATVFEVVGENAIVNPFGQNTSFVYLMGRVEVQNG